MQFFPFRTVGREGNAVDAFVPLRRHKERVRGFDAVFQDLPDQYAAAQHAEPPRVREFLRQQIAAVSDLPDGSVRRDGKTLCKELRRLFFAVGGSGGRRGRSGGRPGYILALLLEFCHKMSLAAVHRKNAAAAGEVVPVAAVKAGSAECHAAVHDVKRRVTLQKRRRRVLVFAERKRAGGVDQNAAGSDASGGAVENAALPHRTGGGMFGRPLGNRRFVAAEHSLSRTGRVHQHAVEESLQLIRQRVGAGVGNHGVAHAHALHVGEKNLRPFAHIFIAPKQTVSLQRRRDLGGFAPRRGAHVQNAFPRLRVQHRDRRHRGRFLRIKRSGVVPRRMSDADIRRVEVKSGGREGAWTERQPQFVDVAGVKF